MQKSNSKALILPIALLVSLSACSDSILDSGKDQIASQCLAFVPAVAVGDQFQHTVHNTCGRNINVLDADTKQRFTILKNGNAVVNLPSAAVNMGACFTPYMPKEQSGDKFTCEK